MPAAAATSVSSPSLDPLLHEVRTWVRRGDISAALDALVPLHAIAATLPVPDHVELVALSVECLLARGDLEAASRWGEQVAELDAGPYAATALHARAELACAHDQYAAALELYLAAGAAEALVATGPADPRPASGWPVPWRTGAAIALVQCGRRLEAASLAEAEHALAVARGDGHDIARALRILATTAADGRAVERLHEARSLLGHLDGHRLAAQIDTDLAGLMVMAGDTPGATSLLRGAERYAAQEKLWPLQSRVRRWLDRIGEEPRRIESEAMDVLTNAERRVAALAVDGLSNRQIAEQLVVSIKAVEGHLSKVYRKLGVASRSGLVETVGRAR